MVPNNYHNFILPKSLTPQQKSLMSVLHINARSASNKGDTITHFLSEFQFFILNSYSTETWHCDDGDKIELDGYNAFVLNRKNRRGGGVAIYVDKTFKCELVSQFSELPNDYETLTVRLNRDIVSSFTFLPLPFFLVL